MAQIYAFLMAVFKAIPIVKGWFDQLVEFHIEKSLSEMKEENRAAVAAALKGNTTELEKLLGSRRAGKASGYDGTEIRDDIPGF